MCSDVVSSKQTTELSKDHPGDIRSLAWSTYEKKHQSRRIPA
jgi:hypothetical protein